MNLKTLLLLRHAKSSWKDAGLADHDRPLKERGRKAALQMGRLMRDEVSRPSLVLCSTACRARQTAELALSQLSDPPSVTYRDDLYHAEPDQIVQILSEVAEAATCVLLIGHNPGMEEFCSRITGITATMPTAALAWIDLELPTWNQLTDSTRGTLQHIWRPRELDRD